jgi:hypothetical protein
LSSNLSADYVCVQTFPISSLLDLRQRAAPQFHRLRLVFLMFHELPRRLHLYLTVGLTMAVNPFVQLEHVLSNG